MDVKRSSNSNPDQLRLVKGQEEMVDEERKLPGEDERKQQIFHRGTLSDKKFEDELPTWRLYVDGSSCTTGRGAGIVLNIPDEIDKEYALRFQFKASNNEAE